MKQICITAILALYSVLLSAGGTNRQSSLALMGLYGWNKTWQSHAGLDLTGCVRVGNHFDVIAAAEVHNPKTFAVTATARPYFQLGVGEVFFDGSTHYRAHSSIPPLQPQFILSPSL